jgi:hypothetical protein
MRARTPFVQISLLFCDESLSAIGNAMGTLATYSSIIGNPLRS